MSMSDAEKRQNIWTEKLIGFLVITLLSCLVYIGASWKDQQEQKNKENTIHFKELNKAILSSNEINRKQFKEMNENNARAIQTLVEKQQNNEGRAINAIAGVRTDVRLLSQKIDDSVKRIGSLEHYMYRGKK